ncbi:XkdX family protein, partial [Dysosmobacter welbionis]
LVPIGKPAQNAVISKAICLHLSAATVKESRQSGNRRLSFVSHFFSLL